MKQITQEEIKGNRLIANFMGLYSLTMREWENYEAEDRDDIHWCDYHKNYHNSWDLLMPVVEKIEEIALDEDEISKVHRFRVDLNYAHCTITDTWGDVIIADVDGNKLTATFMAVSEFCNWWLNSETVAP